MGEVAVTGARRLPSPAREDAVVATVELPRVFRTGTQVLALLALIAGVVGSLTLADGDDRFNIGVIAATYLPWLLRSVGVRFSNRVFAAAVVGPSVVVTVLDLVGAHYTFGIGVQLTPLLIMMMVAEHALAPRRDLIAVAGVAYAVMLAQCLADGSPMMVLAWQLVFVFSVGGIAGVRVGALALATAEEAAAADAVLAERRAVAREVREVVARALAVTVRHIGAAHQAVQRADQPGAVDALEEAERQGRAGLADIRHIVQLLRADEESALDPMPGGVAERRQVADAGVEERLVDLDVPAVRIGASLLAIAIGVATVVSGIALDRDAVFTTVVMAVALVPWVTVLVRGRPLPGMWFAGLVLVAPVLCVVREWLELGPGLWEDHYSAVAGGQFSLILVSMNVVGNVSGTRRVTGLVVGSSCLVVVAWAIVTADLDFVVNWGPTIALCSLACVAIRTGALSIGRAQQALAAHTAAEDRRRIARDVHDVTAHTLAVTMLHVTAARMAVLRGALADADEALEEAERHGQASLDDIQGIVGVLEGAGEGEGAAAAGGRPDTARRQVADVADLVEGFRGAGLEVDLRMRGATRPIADTTGLTVYRVIQEALANAARHGDGTAQVTVAVLDDEVTLDVTNPTGAAPRSANGSGLRGMQERVRAVGGRIDVGTSDRCWAVRARLPLREVPG
jgi:signal transduction histidine kinase